MVLIDLRHFTFSSNSIELGKLFCTKLGQARKYFALGVVKWVGLNFFFETGRAQSVIYPVVPKISHFARLYSSQCRDIAGISF